MTTKVQFRRERFTLTFDISELDIHEKAELFSALWREMLNATATKRGEWGATERTRNEVDAIYDAWVAQS